MFSGGIEIDQIWNEFEEFSNMPVPGCYIGFKEHNNKNSIGYFKSFKSMKI